MGKFLSMTVNEFLIYVYTKIRLRFQRIIMTFMVRYRKGRVFTERERELRKLVIRLSAMKDSELFYFPLTDAAMIQSKDKTDSILLESGRLVYTNTISYISDSIKDDFYKSLLTDVKWRIEKRRYKLRDKVFNKHSSIINEVLCKYQS